MPFRRTKPKPKAPNRKKRGRPPHQHRYTLKAYRPHHLPLPQQPHQPRIINNYIYGGVTPINPYPAPAIQETPRMPTPSSREYFEGSPKYRTPRG